MLYFRCGLVAVLASTLLACAGKGTSAKNPQVSLRRGSAWATYNVKPPQITGPTANLLLEDGHLKGFLASGTVDVRIDGDGATGYGPSGPVNIQIQDDSGETRVDGMWNGAPVNFLFSPALVKGSIIVRQGRLAAQQTSCAYSLEKLEPNGALTGSSTCAGMPQQTRLEVHAATTKVLTPSELVVLLVAAFSAPPLSPSERAL